MSRVLIGDDHNAEAFEDAESLRRATRRFVNGDSDEWKALCSHASDASIAGRAGGLDMGWGNVEDRNDWVRDQYVHGEVSWETINSYVSGDLGFTLQVVRGTVLLKGKAAPEKVEVRVTHILRREEECWKLLHRHADNTIFRRPLAGDSSVSSESEIAAIARDWQTP